MMAMSNKGSIHAMLSWSPAMIEPDKTTSFTFNFMDMLTGNQLRDATYDFVLLKDGQEIVKRQGQTLAGVGSEQFTFAGSQAGSVTLRLENINNSGESVEFSINVVPEFPISILLLLMTITFGAVIIASRYNIARHRI